MRSLCVWRMRATVLADDWCDPAVHRQWEGACGGSEGSGGAGSSCEPSQGGFKLVGRVFGAGSVYPLDGLWFGRVSVVVLMLGRMRGAMMSGGEQKP
jgi:hypothetical protein